MPAEVVATVIDLIRSLEEDHVASNVLAAVRRALLAVAVGVSMTAAALVVNPTPASAAVPDEWGFAFMHNPTPMAGDILDMNRQWGSWKVAFPGDWARVFPGAIGHYRVRFPHLASKNGVAHVTAVAGDARWCQVSSVVPDLTDQVVNVQCYRHGGAPDRARFAVMYSTSSGAPIAAGAYAYVRGDLLGGMSSSFNSAGGANLVTHFGVGQYRVSLPGVGTGVIDGNVQVTAEHPNSPRRCKVAKWIPSGATHDIIVHCFDAANALADSWFNATYQRKRAIFGGLNPPDNLAYLFSSGLGGPSDYNSQGGVNSIMVSGVGQYLVTFPRVGIRETHVQATAAGGTPDYCNLQEVWAVLGPDVLVRNVICFDAAGAQAPNRFFVTYTSRV